MTPSEGIDFWFHQIGCNIIPVDSKNKRPTVTWKCWQEASISEEKLEEWKKGNQFKDGMAVIAGKLWRGPYEGKYLVCIDCDNQKGIDDFLKNCYPDLKSIYELAQITIVEQHLDNKQKAHIYFILERPLKNRGGVSGYGGPQGIEDIPRMEVKSEGKSCVVCTPTVHKNGHKYEIIGTHNPKVLDIHQTQHLELNLNSIYDKGRNNSNSTNKDGQIPIEDLFKDDFLVYEGDRHNQLLRAVDSLIIKSRQNLSFDQIKSKAREWNNIHCRPPLDDAEVDMLIVSAANFVAQNGPASSRNSSDKNDNSFLTKKIVDTPEVYYYADSNNKKIGKYVRKEKHDEITGESTAKECFTNIIIDAVPKKVFVYKNNILVKERLERVRIIFESFIKPGEFEIGPYDNIEAFIKELENKHLVLDSVKAGEALSCIINVHKEKNMVEYIDGITTRGFYLIKDKLQIINPTQNLTVELDKSIVKKCASYLDYLANHGWKNKDIFPTVLKWGIVSPFCFSIKLNSEDFFPWLQLYGCGQTGKTTLGNIILKIWNQDKREKILGFNNIDSVARFGYSISKDTYPILVNEVGSLYTNTYGRHTPIIELMKHSIESITCRGKYFESTNYKEILALSPLILTSNYAPPNDGSYNRRFDSIHFSEEEKKGSEEQSNFKELFEENKQFLSILGDFTVFWIQKEPMMLVNKRWQEIAKEILINFYKMADLHSPEWIERFVEQRDSIDESMEKTHFELRGFFVNKINDAYNKNIRNDNSTIRYLDADIRQKFEYCLKNKLLSFISEMKESYMMVSVDIMNELRILSGIANITSLKDIGVQIGFNYQNIRINGKRMRVLVGQKEDLIKFMDMDIQDK